MKKQLFFSENLEPFAAHCISRWFKTCEEAEGRIELEDACANFWFGMKAFTQLGIACSNNKGRPGPTHFTVVLSNEKGRIAEYIKSKIDINPILDNHPLFRF